jgi:hypothetical protein
MDVEKCAPFTKSPLDPWRGTGREAKRLGLTRQMTLGASKEPDPAVATITRSISPCPCGSKECADFYAQSIKQRDQLLTYQAMATTVSAEAAAYGGAGGK